MVYGIGVKSLGEQLGVVEQEASVFLSDFKRAYPGITRFMDETLTKCKKTGYVETMNGRRRYLPNINSGVNHFSRAAAERQAINTTVQGIPRQALYVLNQYLIYIFYVLGSAADLVKTAMNQIERKILDVFPSCNVPLRPSNRDTRKVIVPRGAYFLLQMHDELLYEVRHNLVVHSSYGKIQLISFRLRVMT
jgi:DNA polymerase theta